MNKQELLQMANKGEQSFDGTRFNVTTHEVPGMGETLNVTLFPLNEFTDYAYFGGGFTEYYTNEDCEQLVPAMMDAVWKMKRQAEIIKHTTILNLKDLNKEDDHCNHLLKGDNNKIYVIQKLKNKDGVVFGFQVLTSCKWTGGYEPSSPINKPITLDGVAYNPLWSFWLDGGYYKIKEDTYEK